MADARDFKIVGNDTSITGSATELRVGAQPDTLRGSASQNKQVFDNYCDMIANHHNDLCDFLYGDTSATIDPSVLLLYASLGWVAP